MFRSSDEEKSSVVKSIIAKLKEISPKTFSEDELAEIAESKSLDETKLKKAIIDRLSKEESEISFILQRISADKTSEKEADIQVCMVIKILSFHPAMLNLHDPNSGNTPFISACKAANKKLIQFFLNLNKHEGKVVVNLSAKNNKGETGKTFIVANFKEDEVLLSEMDNAMCWAPRSRTRLNLSMNQHAQKFDAKLHKTEITTPKSR